jgi:hypothetical protein
MRFGRGAQQAVVITSAVIALSITTAGGASAEPITPHVVTPHAVSPHVVTPPVSVPAPEPPPAEPTEPAEPEKPVEAAESSEPAQLPPPVESPDASPQHGQQGPTCGPDGPDGPTCEPNECPGPECNRCPGSSLCPNGNGAYAEGPSSSLSDNAKYAICAGERATLLAAWPDNIFDDPIVIGPLFRALYLRNYIDPATGKSWKAHHILPPESPDPESPEVWSVMVARVNTFNRNCMSWVTQ